MELLLIIDAARRASASEVSAIIPYFGYSRQDRKDRPRVPISSSIIARLIEYSGVDRILTVDIHSEQEPGFVNIPWDNLYGSYSLLPELKKHFKSSKLVVASPDKGGVPKATFYAELLNAEGMATVFKERNLDKSNESEASDMIGNVNGKDVLLVDDMIDTAGTICNAAELIKEKGAKSICAVATHGLFSPPAPKRISESPLEKVFITDSVPLSEEMKKSPKLVTISIAKLLAGAIKCIYDGSSMSEELIPKAHRTYENRNFNEGLEFLPER